jgi:K+/H+ antiporter YhaU regulatory subunit KhtT
MLRVPSLQRIEKNEIAQLLTAASTETFIIDRDSPSAGKTIGALDLRRTTGATVIAVIREGQLSINPDKAFVFAADDMVVLLGSPEQIELAIEHINAQEQRDGKEQSG